MENSTTQNTSGKADAGKRAIAIIIDAVIASVVGFIPIIGGVIGAAYMLLRDGFSYEFMDHRSLGKKLIKLRPVRLDKGTMDIETSIKRNWMFALGGVVQVLLYIPIIGWFLIPIVGIVALVIGIMEIVFVLKDEEGRRWGDKMANTKVIEVND
jgi:uncharacterized protein involved in cysteine biosynthesis